MAKKIGTKTIPKIPVVIYQTKSGALELRGDATHETVWATQAQIAQMFGVTVQNITRHLKNIYKDCELDKVSTCKESLQVQKEGNREIARSVKYYNLDVIISVGYRINSVIGTNFRIWATKTLNSTLPPAIPLTVPALRKTTTNSWLPWTKSARYYQPEMHWTPNQP